MKIQKRDGSLEQLSFDKIIYRLKKLCNDKSLGVLKTIDPDVVAQRVVSSIYDGVTSTELDEEAARIAVNMTENLEYGQLASRIIISNLHKSTMECFSEVMESLYNNTDKAGAPMPVIADDIMEIIRTNKDTLNFAIEYSRDYLFDYFGYKTLEKGYLLKLLDKQTGKMNVVERPQHLYMRVAVGIHKGDIEAVVKTYHYISQHYYTHASPTMFNASTRLAALSSCYLMGSFDAIEGIYKTITDCARISKLGGGIGVHISNIRAKGSIIRGTNGVSDGIIPMIKVYNSTAAYVNQCITPDTIVYSKDGFKRMDEITTNDYLITNDGSFKKVNEVIVNIKNESLYVIENHASVDPLKCTGEHDIYVIKDNLGAGRVRDLVMRGMRKPEFIPASQVKMGYYMGYPMPTYEVDIPEISKEQCRLYGIFVGDGSIIQSSTTTRYQVTLNNKKKLSTKAFVIDFLNKCDIHYWIANECEISFAYNQTNIAKTGIRKDMLYDDHHDKFIDQRFLHLPKEKASMLLKGLLETDGCQTTTCLWYMTTDKNLVYSIKYLLLRFGILTSCQTVNKVGQVMNYNKRGHPIISRKICYNLRIPKVQVLKDLGIKTEFECQQKVNYFEADGILYTRIKNIQKVHYAGDVYDFNMIDNHNYLTDMGLVHNSGKRKGSFALYTEPWHADILEFLDLKKNQGHDDVRARDLFYALWTPDLFMKQVEADGDWYLMCPDECPGLTNAYGEAFEALYLKYVEEKRYKRVVKAQEVWKKVLDAQIETGVPYIGYKDSVNRKCNQKSLGTIKSSNLCCEISLYSDHKEYAVCNLCSIALPKFVEYDAKGKPFYNFEKLREVSQYVVEPMNKVIDNNHYPTEETRLSNMKHRPLGIGIQGLADVYFKMRIPFESPEAAQLNREIFETLYYGVMRASIDLAKREGPYSSFAGSPFSEGKLQFDLAAEFDGIDLTQFLTGRWDWNALKADLKQYGARNSMLTALMPTASSAQIMNNSECFEPIDSCIFKRRVLSGEYMVVNKYLVAELVKLGLWNKTMKDTIIAHDGSIQAIPEIPDDIKQIYKTVWEVSMKSVIEQSRDRQAFVDQMQSMNLFMANPNYKKLTSMHFYSWKANLKTGMYYLRSRASSSAGKFSIDANLEKKIRAKQESGKKLTKNEEKLLCSIDNREGCEMCSS
uniref:ribonucleoside-diphosphate reductase n=1 Tax=viral metagenome TaxID=1070528 RepID=A0A6C0H6R1_9ZZZZ